MASKVGGCILKTFKRFAKCMKKVPKAPEGVSMSFESNNPMFIKLRKRVKRAVLDTNVSFDIGNFDLDTLDDFENEDLELFDEN